MRVFFELEIKVAKPNRWKDWMPECWDAGKLRSQNVERLECRQVGMHIGKGKMWKNKLRKGYDSLGTRLWKFYEAIKKVR